MAVLDPRLTPARGDIAAASLRGQVEAERFVEGEVCTVVDAQAPLRRKPAPDAALETEALCGERFTAYEFTDEGWAWGQLASDGYVGWMPSAALERGALPTTHAVTALRTLVFPGPSIKIPPVGSLPFGARVNVLRSEGTFVVTARGYVPAVHLADLIEGDEFVAAARRFLGTPYLWGGKTNAGIDCSGLVQVALNATGRTCPRDSDMQERALGRVLTPDEVPARGDLVFWKGHVGIVAGDNALLHANAHHMAVVEEPLDAAIARIAAAGSTVTSIRRLI